MAESSFHDCKNYCYILVNVDPPVNGNMLPHQ
jgi:hypothetical protein